MLAGEQQRGAFPAELGFERCGVPVQFGLELGIGRFVEQLDRNLEIVGARQQAAPRIDLGTQCVCLAEDPLRRALILPEPGLDRQRVELGDAFGLGVEVKVAPRSTGSVRPGRGRRRSPPSCGPGDPGAGSGAAR
jgi:hypothetical protein